MSVREQVAILIAKMREFGTASFQKLCDDAPDTLTIVARFLGLLELFREAAVMFDQPDAFAELTVSWTGTEEGALSVAVDEFDRSAPADEAQDEGDEPDENGERHERERAGLARRARRRVGSGRAGMSDDWEYESPEYAAGEEAADADTAGEDAEDAEAEAPSAATAADADGPPPASGAARPGPRAEAGRVSGARTPRDRPPRPPRPTPASPSTTPPGSCPPTWPRSRPCASAWRRSSWWSRSRSPRSSWPRSPSGPATRSSRPCRNLSAEYTEQQRGFDLRQVAGGWRLYTRAACAPLVEKFVLDGQQAKLSQPALETLAVVAYRQPVSRSRISAVRGVNCDGVMRTLLTRGLIEEAGTDVDSGAILYRTTPLFLEKMGMRSLEELPELAPLLPSVESMEESETLA